jgi:hypothetical protein
MNMTPANKFRQLLDLGYDHLLCVIPPGEPVREAGKRPGRKGPNGWYGVGVREFDGATLQQADMWNGWGGGAGIRCNGKFIAIDIDSMSPEWAAKVHKAALKVLGPAPVRIGRSPKCLLVYRAADRIDYRQVRFDDGVDPAKPGLVECLSGGDGTKWFVAIGTHPVTGKPYTWPEGIPHASQLTTVTEEQISEFFARLAKDLPKAQGAGSTQIDREAVDQESLKGNLEEIAEAVRAIPNDGRFRYDDWIKIAAGIRGACQDDPYVGLDIFCEFSERLPDDELTEDPTRAYNSLQPPFALGADYILSLAEQHGDKAYKEKRDRIQAETWFRDETVRSLGEELFGADVELNASKTPQTKFKTVGFYEAAEEALDDMADPLIKGLLDQGAMSVLYGDSNVGKTFVAMDMAYHIATGRPYAGMWTQQMGVLYVAMEGGRGASKRVKALKAKYNPGEEPPFRLLKSAVDLRNPKIDLNAFIELLKAEDTGRHKIGLVVVDTLARALAGGDENSVVDMGAIVKNVGEIQAAIDTHVMIVHHTGKDRAKGARGHSSLRAATDTELEVSEGLIQVTKQRDLDKAWSSAFSLEVHKLGLDKQNDPITSCTVRLDAVTAGRKREPTEGEQAVLDAIETISETSDKPDRGAKTKDLEAWCKDNLSGMTRDTLNQHIRGLKAKGLISQKARGFWLSERKIDSEDLLGDCEESIFA